MSDRNISDRNIGIFGAGGEIGRNMVRINAERRQRGEDNLPITHLIEGYLTRDQIAELLRNDPVRGSYNGKIRAPGHDVIFIDNVRHEVVRVPPQGMANWHALDVWGVLEASGTRVDEKLAEEHLTKGGAEKVIVTAPTKGTAGIAHTLIVGYNEGSYKPASQHVLTNESCMTKSALHVAEALRKEFGLHAISLTTPEPQAVSESPEIQALRENVDRRRAAIQGYQCVLDSIESNPALGVSSKQYQLGLPTLEELKAALAEQEKRLSELQKGSPAKVDDLGKLGFTPQSTGSQGALTKLFPRVFYVNVEDRAPVADGAVHTIAFNIGREASLEEVRAVLDASVKLGIWEIVSTIRHSSDLIGNPHDAVVDGSKIAVTDGDLVRMSVGYDNAYAPARAALDAMAYVRDH